jgi:hypothetical protein
MGSVRLATPAGPGRRTEDGYQRVYMEKDLG